VAKTPDTDPGTQAEADRAAELAAGKGRATPPRKEQEAARKRPLVPNDRKQATRASRDQVAAARERARVGMAAGEEKYLPVRDKGPQRRYVRDYVDARFSLGEVLLPLVLLVFVSYFFPAIADWLLLAVWVVFVIVAIDCVILGFQVTRKLAAKFGAGKVERGVRWYAAMRAIRLPKPQVKRFQFPK
jgi:hypothetical protein